MPGNPLDIFTQLNFTTIIYDGFYFFLLLYNDETQALKG